MDIAEWRESSYKKEFDNTVKFIETLKNTDPTFSLTQLEAMLQSEYDRQGLAWDGRGEVMEIKIEASIAAIQLELVRWKKELSAV
jgi:hypothetical protein